MNLCLVPITIGEIGLGVKMPYLGYSL